MNYSQQITELVEQLKMLTDQLPDDNSTVFITEKAKFREIVLILKKIWDATNSLYDTIDYCASGIN